MRFPQKKFSKHSRRCAMGTFPARCVAALQCERCYGSGRERVPVELLVKVALELFRIRHESMKPGPDVEALKKGLNSRSAAVRLVAWRAILTRVLDGPAEEEA